jgi:hypothetical protein
MQTETSSSVTVEVNPNKSWRCCKCRHENHHDKWVCSDPACGHERCNNCTDLD